MKKKMKIITPSSKDERIWTNWKSVVLVNVTGELLPWKVEREWIQRFRAYRPVKPYLRGLRSELWRNTKVLLTEFGLEKKKMSVKLWVISTCIVIIFTSRISTGFSGWRAKKISLVLPAGRGESNQSEINFKNYFLINKGLPSREINFLEPN